jgi:hypothetical protein
VIFKEFNIMNSFTLECSFFGKELKTADEPSLLRSVEPYGQAPARKRSHL